MYKKVVLKSCTRSPNRVFLSWGDLVEVRVVRSYEDQKVGSCLRSMETAKPILFQVGTPDDDVHHSIHLYVANLSLEEGACFIATDSTGNECPERQKEQMTQQEWSKNRRAVRENPITGHAAQWHMEGFSTEPLKSDEIIPKGAITVILDKCHHIDWLCKPFPFHKAIFSRGINLAYPVTQDMIIVMVETNGISTRLISYKGEWRKKMNGLALSEAENWRPACPLVRTQFPSPAHLTHAVQSMHLGEFSIYVDMAKGKSFKVKLFHHSRAVDLMTTSPNVDRPGKIQVRALVPVSPATPAEVPKCRNTTYIVGTLNADGWHALMRSGPRYSIRINRTLLSGYIPDVGSQEDYFCVMAGCRGPWPWLQHLYQQRSKGIINLSLERKLLSSDAPLDPILSWSLIATHAVRIYRFRGVHSRLIPQIVHCLETTGSRIYPFTIERLSHTTPNKERQRLPSVRICSPCEYDPNLPNTSNSKSFNFKFITTFNIRAGHQKEFTTFHIEGNGWFRLGRFEAADQCYARALAILKKSSEPTAQQDSVRLTSIMWRNRAIVRLRLALWLEMLSFLRQADKLVPGDEKTEYLMAMADRRLRYSGAKATSKH